MEPIPVRIFFSKTGRAKYVSHLDTMRGFTRMLRKSGLPLWYTQGFNPHLYITFALPIPLGYEGLRESFDIRLTNEIPPGLIEKAIAPIMPEGFAFIEAALPVMEPSVIKWADYSIRLIYSSVENGAAKAWNSLDTFERRTAIETLKRTKRGDQTVDIKPLTQISSKNLDDNAIRFKLRTAAGISLNINPALYLKEFYRWADITPDGVRVVREALLDEGLNGFR